MLRDILRRALLGAFVAALAACSASAAGTTGGWRIDRVLPNVSVADLAALGARDVWLAGGACGDPRCDNNDSTLVVLHWDGRGWKSVTVPGAFVDNPADQGTEGVVATSASNAWVFDGRGKGSVDYTEALHWTGQGWAPAVRLNAAVEASVAPSANDVWAFGAEEGFEQRGYAAHFDGKTWTQRPFPIEVTTASALSASDIWVGGTSAACACGTPNGFAIEHWTGHRWHYTPLPSLGTGTLVPGPVFLTGITARGPRDVWADVAAVNYGTSTNPPGTYLLHWNGEVWARAGFPYAGIAATPVVPDGSGGIWLAVNAGFGTSSSLWLCHYADGQWTKMPVPRQDGVQPDVLHLSRVPGTASIIATGDLSASNDEVILTYGP